jgi:hypothetical protein
MAHHPIDAVEADRIDAAACALTLHLPGRPTVGAN